MQNNWQIYTLHTFSDFMELRIALCLIEARNLCPNSRRHFISQLGLRSTSALLPTPKQMGRQKEWIRFWKTCFELVCWNMGKIGRRVYLTQSSPTTTAFRLAFRCHHLRLCMGDLAEPLWCGHRPERDHSLARQRSKRPKKESPKCERIWRLRSRQKSYKDKRRRDLEFKVGDFVYLKVSPLHSTVRFHVKGKLAPRYVGLYHIR